MSSGSMEQRTEGMKKQAQELIEFAYQRGVKAGHEEMQNQMHEHWERKQQELIEQGRNEAWEAARKIGKNSQSGLEYQMGFDFSKMKSYESANPSWLVVMNYSASEAIEKIREYEEKKQKEAEEIHVGDEVKNQYGFKYFITGIKDNLCWGIGGTGYYQNDIRLVKKTGRTFPEIAEVLKKMKEDN